MRGGLEACCKLRELKKDTSKVRLGLEARSSTPRGLAAAVTILLPELIVVGEEDGLATSSLTDAGDGLSLSVDTGAGDTVAVTSSGPTALQVDGSVAGADLLKDVELARDELTSLGGGGLGVEVGVDVGTGDVDNVADVGGNILLLPDVERLRDGVRTSVAGALGLDDGDQFAELRGGTETVHDGLVTDDEELDHVEAVPLGELVDLLLDLGSLVCAASLLDEDTDNHLHAVLLAGTTDVREGVTVSRVDTEDSETVILELLDVLVDLVLGLAVTSVGGEGGVGDTVVVVAASELSSGLVGGAGRLGSLRRSLLGAGDNWGRGRGGLNLGGSLVGRGGSLSGGLLGRSSSRGRGGGGSSSAGGQARAGEGADVNVAGLGDGHNLLVLSVGTRSIAGRDGVNQNGVLGDGGRDRLDGVGARSRADILSGLNNAGDNTALLGGDLGNGAGNRGGRLDDSGNTANGVSTSGDLGGLGTADSGGLANGDGGGGEGVRAGSRAVVHTRSRHGNLRSRGGDRGSRGRRRGSSGNL